MEHIFDKGVTVKNFVKFVWPSVLMMVVIALYYGFDSVFVANLVGETALASLSIAYPAQGIMWGVAVMLAAGSSAIVAIKMGEGNQKEADEKYTLICAVALVIGLIMTALCLIFMDTVIDFLGATAELESYCSEYLGILIWGFPAAFIGVLFEYFIRVDGNPGFTLFLYISKIILHSTGFNIFFIDSGKNISLTIGKFLLNELDQSIGDWNCTDRTFTLG